MKTFLLYAYMKATSISFVFIEPIYINESKCVKCHRFNQQM